MRGDFQSNFDSVHISSVKWFEEEEENPVNLPLPVLAKRFFLAVGQFRHEQLVPLSASLGITVTPQLVVRAGSRSSIIKRALSSCAVRET